MVARGAARRRVGAIGRSFSALDEDDDDHDVGVATVSLLFTPTATLVRPWLVWILEVKASLLDRSRITTSRAVTHAATIGRLELVFIVVMFFLCATRCVVDFLFLFGELSTICWILLFSRFLLRWQLPVRRQRNVILQFVR